MRFPGFEGEWELRALNEISAKITDGTHDTPRAISNGIPYLTAIHIKDGKIDYENCYFISPEVHKQIYSRCNPELGDLLIVNIGAGTATCALNTVSYEFSLKNVALVKPRKYIIDPCFLEQYQRNQSKKIFKQLTSGGAQPFLSLREIGKLKIRYPSLTEQQKIGSILSLLDKRMSTQSKIIGEIKSLKDVIVTKIFTKRLKFKAENEDDFNEWQTKNLGELTYVVNKRNKKNENLPVYSINNKIGFVPQGDQFEGVDSNERGYDLKIYKVIEKETFAYNPARINVGSIGYSRNLNNVIISSLYVCFKTTANVNDEFFFQYLKTDFFNKQVLENMEGGVRSYLFYENFSRITMDLPSLSEQQKIVALLKSLDKKIEIETKIVNQLTVQKQYFLSNLFI
ncbi:hypothetical protein SRABI27_03779 [Pedobacter sp. Bi27]|uniref:restriction endonuclease subunit S n=1 Tax=Pedobacter sp. Bi27 TaxID=2822351 RepID=UPI001D664DF2|nr:restriction endonuclease subunit S [Pedobacter sp. Bi27]CAH0281193.1 hypothetical protein SRABI27_03779 [Pedobacter sp. Bi27]